MKKKAPVIFLCLLLVLPLLGGCEGMDFGRLLAKDSEQEKQLMHVRIVFTDGEYTDTYVKTLGIEEDSKVYVGGSSTNYMYNARGQVVGAFNYQRVLYITILTEEKAGAVTEEVGKKP